MIILLPLALMFLISSSCSSLEYKPITEDKTVIYERGLK